MPGAQATSLPHAARLRRLRWRARRGLLENDLVLERFFAAHESRLGEDEIAGLDILLDLDDNELLELILGRREPDGPAAGELARRVLGLLRGV
ncbi:MAG: succinate dehydrogenase assembly factor 2 [Burkholderiaceae bacterium]|nr:succinate dehydrogenase assembly factor 2 [Burkholderiaceae bacterium]